MTAIRKQAILAFLGAIVLALSITVMVRNVSLDDELLATIGIIGGIAIIVNSLPSNGKSKNGV